jgi:mannose-6-phosphate isomerase-like protein (cupin superfamily)
MSAYTVRNLREVDNQGVHFGADPSELEVRMARVPLECENSGVSYMKLGPGYRMPYGHAHKQQEEIYVLVTGSGRIKLGDDIVELTPWTAVRIHRDTVRALEAGPDGAELLAVGAPNTGPGDGINTVDWWQD